MQATHYRIRIAAGNGAQFCINAWAEYDDVAWELGCVAIRAYPKRIGYRVLEVKAYGKGQVPSRSLPGLDPSNVAPRGRVN